MAILLTMVAVIFYAATQGFRSARASIEIHESARSALNALMNDLTAAEFTAYDNGVQGYFALSQGPTDPATGAYSGSPAPTPANANWRGAWSGTASYNVNDCVSNGGVSYISVAKNNLNQSPPNNPTYWNVFATDTLTFTTLAPQPSARYAAPEAVEQLALVRYALEWDGGSATLPGGKARPTFSLVKRVRFPAVSDPSLNMDIFNWSLVKTEFALPNPLPATSNDPDVILDIAGLRYAQSEIVAFHVLSMNVRLFCLPRKEPQQTKEPSEAFVETGLAVGSVGGTGPILTDLAVPVAKTPWTNGEFGPLPPPSTATFLLRMYTGNDAGDVSAIPPNAPNPLNPLGPITGATSADTLQCTGAWTTTPATNSQYRVEGDLATVFAGTPNPPAANQPAWCQRVTPATSTTPAVIYNFFGPTYRPPALVEVTLEMTDVRATSSFMFTQRFYIPASER